LEWVNCNEKEISQFNPFEELKETGLLLKKLNENQQYKKIWSLNQPFLDVNNENKKSNNLPQKNKKVYSIHNFTKNENQNHNYKIGTQSESSKVFNNNTLQKKLLCLRKNTIAPAERTSVYNQPIMTDEKLIECEAKKSLKEIHTNNFNPLKSSHEKSDSHSLKIYEKENLEKKFIYDEDVIITHSAIDSKNRVARKEALSNSLEKYEFIGEKNQIKNFIPAVKKEEKFGHYKNFYVYEKDCEVIDLEDNEETTKECILCKWIYPDNMSSEEKNAHINFCLEGRGEEHRENYMKSLKIVTLSTNKDVTGLNSKQELIESCPYCNKKFKTKGQKVKDNHMIDCLRKIQEDDLYKDKKRKTTVRKDII